MKSLNVFCTRHGRLCVAMGILVANSTWLTMTSLAEDVTPPPPAPAAVEEAKTSSEPRRLQSKQQQAKPIGLMQFVKSKFKRTPKRRTTRSNIQRTASQSLTVKQELEAIYSKNGKQMPSMNLSDAPNVNTPVNVKLPAPVAKPTVTKKTQAVKPQAVKVEPRRLASQTQQPKKQSQYYYYRPKPNFMQRMFRVKPKMVKRTRPTPQQRVVQQPVAQPKPAPAPQVAVQKTVAAPPAVVDNSPRAYPVPPAPSELVAEQKTKPAVEVKTAAKEITEPAPKTAPKPAPKPKTALVSKETPVKQPKKIGNSLENPFPELSENEADGVKEPAKPATPFTGMTLKEVPKDATPIAGLKGFCIVSLRNERQLVDAKEEIRSTFQGKAYTFSTKEAQAKFDQEPAKFAPVKGGSDVITLAGGKEEAAGSLDHAVWYKTKLYLFSSQTNLQLFVSSPKKYKVTEK